MNSILYFIFYAIFFAISFKIVLIILEKIEKHYKLSKEQGDKK
jgi:hypothetical protein